MCLRRRNSHQVEKKALTDHVSGTAKTQPAVKNSDHHFHTILHLDNLPIHDEASGRRTLRLFIYLHCLLEPQIGDERKNQ